MADERQKDLLTKLADAGEDAIQRLADMPGAGRLGDTLTGLRGRVDDLQRRVRGVEDLEQRLARLEKRVTELEGKRRAGRRRTAAPSAAESTSSRARATRPRRRAPGTEGTGEERGS